jgi:hypothetical protein
MSPDDFHDCDPLRLAEFLELDVAEVAGRSFTDEELAAMAREEMAAPVCFERAGFGSQQAEQVRAAMGPGGLLPKSLGDLFSHPHPPLELLDLARRFAKSHAIHPRGTLPRPIALLEYFGSIAVALLRHNRQITSLDRQTLAQALQWFGEQPWVSEPLRTTFRDGLDRLRSEQVPHDA